MRVTEGMIVRSFLRNVNSSRQDVNVLNQQLASGNKISKPSDDPIGTESILRYTSAIDKNEIYQKNVTETISSLETTYDTVDGVLSALTDLKDVVLGAGNTQEQDMLSSYAEQVNSIIERLVDLGNTKFNGKYIFAGTNTLSKPYSFDGTTVTQTSSGVDGKIYADIGATEKEVVNINGDNIFNGTELFKQVIAIRDQLKSFQQPTPAQIESVDTNFNSVTEQYGKIGAITERFTAAQTQLENENTRLQNYLGLEKSIDLGETVVKLTQAQTNLEAAFKSWSGVLQKTLFNFLS
jgi:flagellar hook-associated protein 3 FlgL